jgi:hypothetical protein
MPGSLIRSSTSRLPLMLPFCRSSNVFLRSPVFSSDSATGSPPVGGR